MGEGASAVPALDAAVSDSPLLNLGSLFLPEGAPHADENRLRCTEGRTRVDDASLLPTNATVPRHAMHRKFQSQAWHIELARYLHLRQKNLPFQAVVKIRIKQKSYESNEN